MEKEYEKKLYRTFRAILQRCYDKNSKGYKYYGGRGIRCLWKTFKGFRKSMVNGFEEHMRKYGARNTSIDRIDNDGNYCSTNCRWVTQKEQANNTRRTKKIKYNGCKYTLSQLSNVAVVSRSCFFSRMKKGWTLYNALKLPSGKREPIDIDISNAKIKPREKLVLELHLQGQTYKEIGEKLGVSRQMAYLIKVRAEKNLTKLDDFYF
jgi:hypothetical protein